MWELNAYVGVFDASATMMFVFDAEFGVVYCSFDPACLPENFEDFAKTFNARFAEVFVRDARFRTGADPVRAEEYYRRAFAPVM